LLPKRITELAVSFDTEDDLRLSGRLQLFSSGDCSLDRASPESAIVDSSTATVAVIAHPNPRDGGTMQNKVVDVTTRTLAQYGMSTLRFNFRGVGESEGEMTDGVEEDRDIRAAVRFLKDRVFQSFEHQGQDRSIRLVLAGFSFGSAMAIKSIVAGLSCDQLILIGLPLAWRPIPSLPVITEDGSCVNGVSNTHVVIGDNDEFCSVDQARRWVRDQQPHWARLSVVPNAGHFFHKRLPALAEAIDLSLSEAGVISA